MFKSNCAHCCITSWVGYGGEHFYGEMIFHDEIEIDKIELTYNLSRKQALYLNKKEREEGWGTPTHKPGDDCTRFNSEEDIQHAAIKYLDENNLKEKIDFLFEGDGAGCPCYCIWSKDEKIKENLNKVFFDYDKVSMSKKADTYIDRWENEARKYNFLEDWEE